MTRASKTILDRLAGAMKTLGKREGKALTPRQRVAAAQRWNSLADVAKEEWTADSDKLLDAATTSKDRYEMYDRQRRAQNEIDKLYEMGLISEGHTGDNPFRFDWMGEPHQYEARLKNYRPLTDAQYERMIEREEEARLRGFEDFPDDFDYMWRY